MNIRTQTSGKHKIIVICGPTGTGKTSTAIQLAQEFNGEIISADSMQIYRYMDIGTAKATRDEQMRVPHHLVDIVEPDQPFDAAKFSQMAEEKIADLIQAEKVPFVVGGTGLYIKALVHGLFQSDPSNSEIREKLKRLASEKGIESLYYRLETCDPEAAERIHPKDSIRIIRALEIFEQTGNPMSRIHDGHRFAEQRFDALKIGLSVPRDVLYDRINRRVDEMIQAGFLKEVRFLLNQGYGEDHKSMQSIGYRHMAGYINGRLTWGEAVTTMKRDTRRYAKRQMTWFRADTEINWFEPSRPDSIRDAIFDFFS